LWVFLDMAIKTMVLTRFVLDVLSGGGQDLWWVKFLVGVRWERTPTCFSSSSRRSCSLALYAKVQASLCHLLATLQGSDLRRPLHGTSSAVMWKGNMQGLMELVVLALA
jgi:hypothetical protein